MATAMLMWLCKHPGISKSLLSGIVDVEFYFRFHPALRLSVCIGKGCYHNQLYEEIIYVLLPLYCMSLSVGLVAKKNKKKKNKKTKKNERYKCKKK